VPGAILAVPLLVTFKAFADHLDSWQGIGIFLGGKD
jgi:predicted PurR-regulated permease PerM